MRKKEGDKATEILNAAIRIFARDGFDKAQVSAIAALAGVGTGSIYLYFEGKEDILRTLFTRFWDHLAQEMAHLRNDDPLFLLNDQLGLFFDHLAIDPDLAKIYLREHHRYLETSDGKDLTSYLHCLEIGRSAFVQLRLATNEMEHFDPVDMELCQAILFGGLRAALEFLLANETDSPRVRSQMLTMAMAGILASIQRKDAR